MMNLKNIICAYVPILFVLLWFVNIHQVLALPQPKLSQSKILLEVVPESQEIYPFLSLHVWVVLRNDGDQAEDVVISLPVGLRYAYDLNGPWFPYTPRGMVNAAHTPPFQIVLQPGESRRWPFIIDLALDRSGENIFHILRSSPGRIYLQAVIDDLLSMPIEIKIRKPDDANCQAIEFLRENPLLAWGFSERILLGIEQLEITREDIDNFIHLYGTSLYANYARLGKNILLLNSNDGAIQRNAIEELLEMGVNGPARIQARALWYAAQGMEAGGDQRVCTLKRARNASPDDFFSVLITSQLSEDVPSRANAHLAPDDPVEAGRHYQQLIDQLKKEGYDTDSLREQAPDAWQEYHQLSAELDTRYFIQGNLTARDYYEQKAILAERFTRKYLTPMSQEELADTLAKRTVQQRERKQEFQEQIDALDPQERAEQSWLMWKLIQLGNQSLDDINDDEVRRRLELERQHDLQKWLAQLPPDVAILTAELLSQKNPPVSERIRKAWEDAMRASSNKQ